MVSYETNNPEGIFGDGTSAIIVNIQKTQDENGIFHYEFLLDIPDITLQELNITREDPHFTKDGFYRNKYKAAEVIPVSINPSNPVYWILPSITGEETTASQHFKYLTSLNSNLEKENNALREHISLIQLEKEEIMNNIEKTEARMIERYERITKKLGHKVKEIGEEN